MKFVDKLLNGVTMYRLVLYLLLGLWLVAMFFAAIRLLPYSALAIFLSGVVAIVTCWGSNVVLAKIFKAPANVESPYITALILALIVEPIELSHPTSALLFLMTASMLAMASKYIVAIKRKHLFNPAAFAMGIMAALHDFHIYGEQNASWWVGSASLAPFVLLGGILVVRKIRRADLVLSFAVTFLVALIGLTWARQTSLVDAFVALLVDSPLLFFAFFLLTEPLTTPPTRKWRIVEGALVGFLSALTMTPGAILLVGNLFSYLVSPKQNLVATLCKATEIAPDTYNFVFTLPEPLRFVPGQYAELTLAHKAPDSRGNRRYFTIASSPTEEGLQLGIKFYEPKSSFKAALKQMQSGAQLVISAVAGDFTLPKDQGRKVALIAGGIGITPFRSMVKYLIDVDEKRDIVLIYLVRTCADIAFQELFEEARQRVGLRICYVATDEKGQVTAEMLQEEIADWQERTFYLSGSHAMVSAFETTLRALKVPRTQIKTDFFPGYA